MTIPLRASHLLSAAGVVLFALTYASAQTPRPAAAPPAAAPTAEAAARPVPAGNVEHGRYLAEHVAMCVECHSGRDGQGNILASERYLGAPIPFMPPWPNDWATRAPRNKGLPGYTDAQAQRLLTQGAISRTGLQLKPPMPRFRMTPQDAADITAFLRSLP